MDYKEKSIKNGKWIVYEQIPYSEHSVHDLIFRIMKLSLSNLDIAALSRDFMEYLKEVFTQPFAPYLLIKNEEGKYIFITYSDDKLIEKEVVGLTAPQTAHDFGLFHMHSITTDPEIAAFLGSDFNSSNFISYFNETTFEDTYIGMWKGLYLPSMTEGEHLTMTFVNKVLEENVNIVFKNAYDRIERQKEKIVLEEKVNTLSFLHTFIIELTKNEELDAAIDFLCMNIADNLYINTVLFYIDDPVLSNTFYLKKNTTEDMPVPETLILEKDAIPEDCFDSATYAELLPAEFQQAEVKRGVKIMWEDMVKAYIFLSGSWGNIDGSDFTDSQIEVVQIMANMAGVTLTKIEKQMQLRYFSIVDPLTKLNNRRYFDESLSKEFNRYKRNNSQFSLLLFDIDHFKKFNDTYGHDVGDLVLIHVASAAKEAVRVNDVICRFGGEEFTVIMPDTDSDGAFVVAERIRAAIEALRVSTTHGDLSVTVSIGVSVIEPEIASEVLLKHADQALYYSKSQGRNRSTIFGPECINEI